MSVHQINFSAASAAGRESLLVLFYLDKRSVKLKSSVVCTTLKN